MPRSLSLFRWRMVQVLWGGGEKAVGRREPLPSCSWMLLPRRLIYRYTISLSRIQYIKPHAAAIVSACLIPILRPILRSPSVALPFCVRLV